MVSARTAPKTITLPRTKSDPWKWSGQLSVAIEGAMKNSLLWLREDAVMAHSWRVSALAFCGDSQHGRLPVWLSPIQKCTPCMAAEESISMSFRVAPASKNIWGWRQSARAAASLTCWRSVCLRTAASRALWRPSPCDFVANDFRQQELSVSKSRTSTLFEASYS